MNKEDADRIRRGNIPPVLDVPEYTGPIAGAGLDGEGGQITPPVLEVPEYTGVLAGAGLDGEGGEITPPVLDVPEYKGEIMKEESKEDMKEESKEEPKEEPKKELSKKEAIKLADVPSVKTSKTLPETGNDNYATYGLVAVLLGFLTKLRGLRRKNNNQ